MNALGRLGAEVLGGGASALLYGGAIVVAILLGASRGWSHPTCLWAITGAAALALVTVSDPLIALANILALMAMWLIADGGPHDDAP